MKGGFPWHCLVNPFLCILLYLDWHVNKNFISAFSKKISIFILELIANKIIILQIFGDNETALETSVTTVQTMMEWTMIRTTVLWS